MDEKETYCEAVIRYLDNEFSDEEELLFVKQLAENSELQQALDIELMLRDHGRQLSEAMETDPMFEPADSFLARAKATLPGREPDQSEPNETTPVIFFHNRKRLISVAASVIAIVAASFLYFNYLNHQKELAENKNKPDEKNKSPIDDTSHKKGVEYSASLPADNNYLAALSDENYSRYNGTSDDPAQVGLYLEYYLDKKYTKVLQAKKADYQSKGSSTTDEQQLLESYVVFYKALSYRETGQTAESAKLLKSIVANKTTSKNLYYQSQWYLLLDYMKLKDKKNTQALIAVMLKDLHHPNRQKVLDIDQHLHK